MGQVLQLPVNLVDVDCGECGGTYAVNERFHEQKRQKGGYWHCPYCQTSWGFGEGENSRLKKELTAEKARRDRALQEANENRQLAEKTVKAINRLKKRVTNGVCPCCNRTFQNLARHMKTKHPHG